MKGSKKGKKTFSEGLGELLHHTLYEDNLHDKPSMLIFDEPTEEFIEKLMAVEDTPPNSDDSNKSNSKQRDKKKNKSFTNRLEDFFNDSVEEGSVGRITSVKRNITRDQSRPTVGIDVLLQRTLVEEEQLPESTQRVTFVLDADKVEKLKQIARRDNKQLNEVVLELIELYLGSRPSNNASAITTKKQTTTNKTNNKKSKTP
jgi:hypothetical protein